MSQHIVPTTLYYKVATTLFLLLVLTVWVAFQPLGIFNLPVAMTIAIVKAVMIVMFFMHVKWNSRLIWVFSGAAFFWLLILFGLTIMDYLSRGWIPLGR